MTTADKRADRQAKLLVSGRPGPEIVQDVAALLRHLATAKRQELAQSIAIEELLARLADTEAERDALREDLNEALADADRLHNETVSHRPSV